jgi:hypothetical protein
VRLANLVELGGGIAMVRFSRLHASALVAQTVIAPLVLELLILPHHLTVSLDLSHDFTFSLALVSNECTSADSAALLSDVPPGAFVSTMS